MRPQSLILAQLSLAGTALCLFLAGSPVAQPAEPIVDYFDGLRSWETGDKETAVGIWIVAANRGDPRSMHRLGVCYEQGDPCHKDPQISLFWFLAAQKAGSSEVGDDVVRVAAGLPPIQIEEARKQAATFVPSPIRFSIWEALETKSVETLASAMEAAEQVDTRDPNGYPLLGIAAATGSSELFNTIIFWLQTKRLNLTNYLEASTDTGITSLHIAAALGHSDIAERMLRLGINAMIPDQNGTPPYVFAERRGHVDLAKTLKEAYDKEVAYLDGALREWGYLVETNPPHPTAAERDFAFEAFKRAIGVRSDGLSREAFDSYRKYLNSSNPIKYTLYYVYKPSGESRSSRAIGRDTVTAYSKRRADALAREQCNEVDGECLITGSFPNGMCVELVWGGKNAITISRPKPTSDEAREDALALCKRTGSGCATPKSVTGEDWRLCSG